MNQANFYTVKETSEILNLSTVTLYKKIKQLESELKEHIIKNKRGTFLSENALEIIKKDSFLDIQINTQKIEKEDISNKYIESLQTEIEHLKEQLKTKDKQLENRDNQLNNFQILLLKEQEKSNLLLISSNNNKNTEVIKEDHWTEKKKFIFFKRKKDKKKKLTQNIVEM